MSYFDDASLVMIPSGYKTSKVYSVKPTDGTGDLTFTRSNDTATRVGPDGLIQKVRTNLVLQSEAFNTTWATNASPTITANTTIAPNGTLTADTIASTTGSSGVYQVPTVASGVEHSFSVYIKNITTATNIQIGCDLGPINGFLNFNAVTGAITSTAAGITGSSVTSVGNGWYRVSGTYNSTGTTNTFIVFGQSGMSFAVWGAQFETGVTTNYIATTTAAVSVGPVANVPRLDYLNSSCPRLLLEPQRTNVLTYSEQLNNAAWALDGNGAGQSVTANYAVSPDGYTNADRVQLNRTGGTYSRLRQDYVAAGTHTGAVYLKSNTGASQKIWMRVNGAAVVKITITTSWQRFVVSQGSAVALELFIDNTDAEIATIADFSAWGAQLEAGAYATSYIPTLGSASTRGSDACSKTGISSLIGQTEGTIFFSISESFALDSTFIAQFDDGTNSNRIGIVISSGLAEFFSQIGGSTVAQVNAGAVSSTGAFKCALAYANNDYAFAVNGVIVGTDTSGAVPATSVMRLGNDSNGNGVKGAKYDQALLFKTRLTNAQLAELTTI